jgi:RHS repeat-associated protein
MPKAARIDDSIAHSHALEGLVAGLVVGALVGAFVIGTGGTGALLIAAAAGASTGAGIGQMLGHAFMDNSGVIIKGAKKVKIGRRWAARAVDDKVGCHPKQLIAQGSRTVIIEDFPASRIGDKTVCDGTISSGSANVEIGKEPGTYAKIGSEIPLELHFAVEVLGLIGAYGGKIGSKSKLTKGKSTQGKSTKGKSTKGKSTKGKSTKGKSTKDKLRNKPSKGTPGPRKKKQPTPKKAGKTSGAPEKKQTCTAEPVDVATGAVVDSATDLTLPGLIPVTWERHYGSTSECIGGPFGDGGWAHDLDQWIQEEDDVLTLRAEEGRDIYFAHIQSGTHTFHRAERLTLSAEGNGRYTVYDHVSRLTRVFEPLEPGDRAVLRAIVDEHSNQVILYYDAARLERIVDTAGREIVVHSDSLGRIVRVEVQALGAVVQWVNYSYHLSGELACAVDALGHTERYEYDDLHYLIQKTLKNGTNFYYEYDEETGRCVSTWGDGGLYDKDLEYDEVERTTVAYGEVDSRVYEWNEDGIVLREETLDGDVLRVVELDEDGLVVAEGVTEDALTLYAYDDRGNRTRMTDPAGNITEWAYQDDLPQFRSGPDGLRTQFYHDERGSLVSVRYPSEVTADLSYDAHGRLTEIRDGGVPVFQATYDAEHNLETERDGRGATTRYEHDALGRPVARTDTLGRVTRVEYDILDRVRRHITPDGAMSEFEHDALGNATQAKDALGHTTLLEYEGTGVLSRLVQPDGEAWTIRHDLEERLTEIRNPHQESYNFEYDDAGRLERETTFDGRTLRYRYTDAGFLESIDYPDGTFRVFEHDELGNVTKEIAQDGRIEVIRDNLGRIERAEFTERSGKVVTEMVRDHLGRVVVEKQNGRAIVYTYDAHGRRTSRSLPDGSATRYGYDPLGALVEVDHNGRKFALDRDALGRESARRAVDGSVEIRNTYDAMDRLVGRGVVGGAAHAALSQRSWQYDALGRVREIGDSRWGTTVYHYDQIDQLVEARRGARREVFQYDITGSLRNILSGLSEGGQARTWETEPGNLLKSTDSSRYEYDARGRRVKRVARVDGEDGARAGEVTEYIWDDRDRLREVKKPGGERVLFTYDVFGRRVQKQMLPGETQTVRRVVEFLWDGDELAADIDSRRGTRVFVHEPGTFVPMLHAELGEVFAVVNDHLGMPKELVDEDGRVAWSAAHSAWGRVVEEYRDPAARRKIGVESPFRLLGQYADEETGLCYTRFRYFDAEVGRWCSPDPLGLVGGLNLTGFDGTPTNVVDPLGLCVKNNKGGRLGNDATRAHVSKVADELEKRGWKITGGGGRMKEEYLPGPGGGRKGSNWVDITATKNGKTLRINTVDTRLDGKTPTTREANAALSIRKKTPGDHLVLIPKPK